MRFLIFATFAVVLAGCESSGSKDPNAAMDDTARMRNPPPTDPVGITPAAITEAMVLPEVKFKGKFQDAWKWNDALGENILVLSTVAPYDDKAKNKDEEDGQTAEINAVQYAKKDGPFTEIWVMNEKVQACPFDITSEFIPKSTTMTDLDKNGIAEIKLQYRLACRSDVSPAEMKLVMYENGVKYGLVGSSWIAYSPDTKFAVKEADVNLEQLPPLKDETEAMLRSFGRYQNEKEFAAAPAPFLPYARKEWLKYVIERTPE